MMGSREDFNNTWLTEMPEQIDQTEMYDMIKYNISDLINSGSKVDKLSDNFNKIEGNDSVYYWYENKTNKILLGAEFQKKPQSLTVNIIGKYNKGKPPYASDLYNAVLIDRNSHGVNSIRIKSDVQLSDEGFNIWKKLMNSGHKISVYNSSKPGTSFITVNTINDMKKYFKNDTNFRKYQYIISENTKLLETKMSFNTRRMRELGGLWLGE